MTQGFIQMQKEQEKLKKQKDAFPELREMSKKLDGLIVTKKIPKLQKN